MKNMREYIKRDYRAIINTNLTTFQVSVKETDLLISADHDLSEEALKSVHKHRQFLETYIKFHPEFQESHIPLSYDKFAPEIVKDMLSVSKSADVGPMAAVAGAMSQFTGNDLLTYSANIIVENGGDVFVKTLKEIIISIFAGESPLSYKVNLKINPGDTPIGICTSSGTVGPSVSYGNADAVCVISNSASLADAAATSIGNKVLSKSDIGKGIERAKEIKGVTGVVIIVKDKMGAWGEVEMV